MAEELQTPASDEQTPVTPDAQTVQPEPKPKMVPETDLRALQSMKDKALAAKDKAEAERDAVRQQMDALQASMEGQMDALARTTMEPEDYSAFAGQRQQEQQAIESQRQQYEAQKYRAILTLASQHDIPISAFDAVIASPRTQYDDAHKVVVDYLNRKIDTLSKQAAARQQEADQMGRQAQRQDRHESGADSIGSPAEPATGSPDLEAKYQKERQEILIGSSARPTARNWTQEMLNLKARYRELGLDI